MSHPADAVAEMLVAARTTFGGGDARERDARRRTWTMILHGARVGPARLRRGRWPGIEWAVSGAGGKQRD
ncbi:MAG: hypothetical protein MUC54_08910 [Chloroflexi bacterium]|jgi:hypothetical protein|nr:hypothetical protein [Chloroflexota bacterium]